MNELKQQVQSALRQAKKRLDGNKLHPDDAANLNAMQTELESKANQLHAMCRDIAAFRMSLLGHYS